MKRSVEYLGYLLTTGIVRGSSILIMPIFLNVLSLEEYGRYLIINTLAKLSSRFLNLSGTNAILIDGSKEKNVANKIYSSFYNISIINFLPLLAISYLLFYIFDINLTYLLFCPLAVAESSFQLKTHYCRATNNLKNYSIYSTVKFLSEAILLSSIVLLDFTLSDYILLLFFFQIVIFHNYQSSITQALKVISNYTDISPYKYIFPLIPGGVIAWILNSSDKLMIESLISTEQVATYSVGYNLGSIILILTAALAIWLPSEMFKNFDYWKTSKAKMWLFSKLIFAFILFYILVIAGYYVDRDYFNILKVYSKEIEMIIGLTFIGGAATGFMAYYANIIQYMKHTRFLLFINLISCIINISINYIYLSKYGIITAAWSTVIAFTVQLLLTYFYSKYLLKRQASSL